MARRARGPAARHAARRRPRWTGPRPPRGAAPGPRAGAAPRSRSPGPFQGRRPGGVPGSGLARQQRGQQDLGEQGVPEPHPGVSGRPRSPAPPPRRPRPPRPRRPGRGRGHLGEVRQARGSAADGQHLGHLPGRRRHPVPGGEQRLAERVGQTVGQAGRLGRETLDQHLGEVRVAAGPVADLAQETLLHRPTQQPDELVLGLLGTQAAERQGGDGRHASHVGQPAQEEVPRGLLLVPVGGDDGQGWCRNPAQRYPSASHVAGAAHWTSSTTRTVGPSATIRERISSTTGMSRTGAAGPAPPSDGSSSAAPETSRSTASRSAVGASCSQPSKRQHEREVRRLHGAEPEASPHSTVTPARAGVGDHRAHQAGLADARLAVDEDGAGLARRRPVDPLAEQSLLVVAADDARRRDHLCVAHRQPVCPSGRRLSPG